MFRSAVVLFCLLFLCTGLTVQADTLSGNQNTATYGQTEVTARVEASPDEEGPSDENNKVTSDGNSQMNGHRHKVETGDRNRLVTMFFLFLISSIVIVAEIIRMTAK